MNDQNSSSCNPRHVIYSQNTTHLHPTHPITRVYTSYCSQYSSQLTVGAMKNTLLRKWEKIKSLYYLFKPSPQIIDVYPHNFIFPPNLLKFEPFDFFDLIPFKFEPTNFNTLLKDSIETKKSISIWKLKFFYGFLLIIGGLVKHFLHITEKLKSLYIQYWQYQAVQEKSAHIERKMEKQNVTFCRWINFEGY